MNRRIPDCFGGVGRTALLAIASLAILAFWGQPADAAVTKAVLKPTMGLYSGDCPATMTFKGSISVDAPGTVTYVFIRSDGATDTNPKTIKFLAAGTRTVDTTWTLGGPSLPNYKGWQAVKVLKPKVLESAHANFEVRCDPPLNSAKAAHGNTDWHIDTANEFLFGQDMAGHNTAANFAPAGWTKTHIHVGQTNAAHFYSDDARVAGSDDTDLTNGIDKPMLFFYAGHGNPTTWNALGTNGHPADVLFGNLAGGGQLRYFWQCSCEVFAHGPRVCSGSDCDYSEPENFDGSADSVAMRNVFERWGPAIGDDLRMACGVSTLAYCHEGNVNAIWNKFNNEGSTVAEAFILGLGSASVKPLCITRGGPDISKTPLYDETFSNRRNTSGNTYLHILYAAGTQTEPPSLVWTPDKIPHKLWRVRILPPGDPVEFKQRLEVVDRTERLRDAQFAGAAAVVKRNPANGAISLKALRDADVPAPRAALGLAEQRTKAMEFARRIGWLDEDAGAVQVTNMLTASMPVGGDAGKITRGAKDVVVRIGKRVRNGEHALDVLGGGTTITLAPGGEVLAAARTSRRAVLERDQIAIKPFETARAEAIKRVREAGAYKLADWRFGYQDTAGRQEGELAPVYEFDFVPKDRDRLLDYPPQRIEVGAEMR